MANATLSVSLRFNGEPTGGGSIPSPVCFCVETFISGDRRAFLRAVDKHGNGDQPFGYDEQTFRRVAPLRYRLYMDALLKGGIQR